MASAKELREKTDQELQDQLALEKKNMFDSIVRGASGEAIKPHEKRMGKHLIARIETILRERKLRQDLESRLTVLEGKSKDAKPEFVRMAAADPRPALPRVKIKGKDLTAADRAAIQLGEAKRLQASLVREDPGQSK